MTLHWAGPYGAYPYLSVPLTYSLLTRIWLPDTVNVHANGLPLNVYPIKHMILWWPTLYQPSKKRRRLVGPVACASNPNRSLSLLGFQFEINAKKCTEFIRQWLCACFLGVQSMLYCTPCVFPTCSYLSCNREAHNLCIPIRVWHISWNGHLFELIFPH